MCLSLQEFISGTKDEKIPKLDFWNICSVAMLAFQLHVSVVHYQDLISLFVILKCEVFFFLLNHYKNLVAFHRCYQILSDDSELWYWIYNNSSIHLREFIITLILGRIKYLGICIYSSKQFTKCKNKTKLWKLNISNKILVVFSLNNLNCQK